MENIAGEVGETAVKVSYDDLDSHVKDDANFQPFMTGIERWDNDRYIYFRVDGSEYYKVNKTPVLRSHLLSLGYMLKHKT